LSPDGNLIAVQALSAGFDQIFLLETNNEHSMRQLTFGDFNHRAPNWSPDGRRLVMSSDRGGDLSIWELEIDSLKLAQLTFRPGNEYDPAWNYDATRLAFVAREAGHSVLYGLIPGGSPQAIIRQQGRIYSPAWRPDNSVITFAHQTDGISRLSMAILSKPPVVKPVSRNERVFPKRVHWIDRDHLLYTADGRIRVRKFGASQADEIPFEVSIELKNEKFTPKQPDFDDTGRRPVRGTAGVTSGKSGTLVVSALGDLWEITQNGELADQLTNDAYVDNQPVAAQNGSKLAFVSDRSGSLQLWLMNRERNELRVLTSESGAVMHPQWSSDNDSLIYLVAQTPLAERFLLKRISLTTGETVTLAEDLREPSAPSWNPQQGIILATQQQNTANNLRGPSQLLKFDADTDGKSTLALANLNAGEITEPRWSPDGRRLMFIADRSLMIADVKSGIPHFGNARTIHTGPISYFRWIAANQALIVSAQQGLASLDIESGRTLPVALPVTWRPAIPSGRKIIRAGRIYNGIAPTYLEKQEIVIEGNRIVAVRPWSDPIDSTEHIIDVSQHTVMPGLIDLAVRQQRTSSERIGRIWLAFGVTGIREDVRLPAEAMEQRESWRQGRRPGPRLFIRSRACTMHDSETAPESMIEAAQHFAARGGNTIAGCAGLSEKQQELIVASSHAAGLPFASHSPFPGLMIGADEVPLRDRQSRNTGIRVYGDVLDSIGMTGAAVVSRLGPTGLPEMARHTPILSYLRYQSLYSQGERDWYKTYFAEQYLKSGALLKATARSTAQSLFIVAGRGGRVTTGSGSPLTPPGLGLHVELQLLADTGLQPFQVLKMATLDAARTLGRSRDLGSIEPGKLADLIVVEGDPLVDITAAANVLMTMVNGRPHYLPDLL